MGFRHTRGKFLRRRRSGETGAVFIATLLVIGSLVIVSGSVLGMTGQNVRSSAWWQDQAGAIFVAESGVNEAIYRLRWDPTSVPLRSFPSDAPSFERVEGVLGPRASFRVWVEADAGDPALRRITAVGRLGDGSRRVRTAVFRLLDNRPFTQATTTTGGGVDPYVVVPPPAGLDCSSPLVLTGGSDEVILSPGSYCYSSIRAQTGRLVVTGPVRLFVRGPIDIAGNAQFNTAPLGGVASDLLIYVMDDVDDADEEEEEEEEGDHGGGHGGGGGGGGHGCQTDEDEDEGPSVCIRGTAQVVGGIYAPDSEVELSGTVDIRGGVVAGTLVLNGTPTVEHDLDLADVEFPEHALNRWEQVPGSWEGP